MLYIRFFIFIACLLFLAPHSALADAESAIDFIDKKQWEQAKAEAAKTGGALVTLVEWQYATDPDSGASFDEIMRFINQHPQWPDMKKARVRAEIAMRLASLSDNAIIDFFTNSPPETGVGKWTYVEALKRQNQKPELHEKLIKEAWRDADLGETEENEMLTEFGDYLGADDHIARIDRLLWNGKHASAQHLIEKAPVAYQTMFAARVALIEDDANAGYLVEQVTGKLAHDPGLLYERMRFRARRNDNNGVREILLETPREVPYPERWWKLREPQIRSAIDEGNIRMASKLLANHAQTDGSQMAEAEWLSGWIKLSFQDNPKEAYEHFYRMYDNVKFPVSKARAAYWAARAAKDSNNDNAAREWFTTAAQFPTAFYGQLAYAEIHPDKPLQLPAEPSLSGGSIPADLTEAVRITIRAGAENMANRLIKHLIDRAENENTIFAVAQLGHELHAPHISVKAAKRAQQQGVVLKKVGYPRPKTDKELPLERALTLAIIRQESEFNPKAESPAGARGMMQLLPGTAKETAKKIDTPYHRAKLDDPAYNILLGSHYLARMVGAFDDSYIMGIAAYNAGPGNVRKWVNRFGAPPQDLRGAIDWLEKIPFEETRNYLQRVMENIQVYRTLEDSDAKLSIANDLVK